MLTITLDRQHTMHLEMHHWVRVDDYIIIQEFKNQYLFAKLVDGDVEAKLDAQVCQVILKEEN